MPRLRFLLDGLVPVVLAVAMLTASSLASFAQAPDPDLNDDGIVNILDISRIGGCFGRDLATNPQCGLVAVTVACLACAEAPGGAWRQNKKLALLAARPV